jgi:hypothetical protein
MHHPSAASPSDCSCRSTALDPSTGAVAALIGHTGILTDSSALLTAVESSRLISRFVDHAASWIAAPDGPPPRA